ncbi:hypothetical protein [Dyadobacter sp. NIV53]|uniref:hypothetical protein n=1 Tax=Dyadobacter sp. NIV53 TaxID=2861765 RepID=UPI001C87B93B|nr:hypothetical protein [Dyadobacter sp. NIV53]
MKKFFTGLNPLISGLLIGAAGGTIGTLIYNAIKNTKVWNSLSFLFDYALKLVNITYKLPLFLVIILLVLGVGVSFFYISKTTKS